MRYFLTSHIPDKPRRILLVESGERDILEGLIPGMRKTWPAAPMDLFTCFPGAPRALGGGPGDVYRSTDYRSRNAQKALVNEFLRRHYDVIGIICSEQPILTRWKWILAAVLPGKVFIVNENGDTFFLDRFHMSAIRGFVLYRTGLAGPEAVQTILRALLFPFTFSYLLLYAAVAHSRRALRKRFS